MSPQEAFNKFQSLKIHFNNPKYDVTKYNGKLKIGKNFESRNDKFFYYRLARKQDVDGLIISNLIENPDLWIGDLLDSKCDEIHIQWSKRQQSLTYQFKNEIKILNDDFNSNFIVSDGQHPHLLNLYKRKQVSIETMIILDEILNYVPKWDKRISDTIIWPKIRLSLIKYKPFVKFDTKKLKKILKECFIS